MYKENFVPWLEKTLSAFRKSQVKTMVFFLCAACEIETFVLAKVGQRGTANTPTDPRNGVKRLNLLLKNPRITTEKMYETSIRNFKRFIRKRKRISLIIDWTYHKEKFVTCCVAMNTAHKRGVPIVSFCYEKGKLGAFQSQNKIEEALLTKVLLAIPSSKEVIVTADRGFDRASFVSFLRKFGRKIHFVVRVKRDKHIFYKGREIKIENIPLQKGQRKNFSNVFYTQAHRIPIRLVAIWDKRSEHPWYLITDIHDKHIKTIGNYYARRWDIESMFRSMKDGQVGFDLKKVRLQHAERWTRLFFLATLILHFFWEIAEEIDDTKVVEKAFSLARRKKYKPHHQKKMYSIYYIVLLLFRCEKIQVRLNSKCKIRVILLLKPKTGSL